MSVFLQDPDVTLWHGDVLETLAGLPDGSVDCVVTSPPYWGLRDYGTGLWEGGDPECDHKTGRNARNDGDRNGEDGFAGNRNLEGHADMGSLLYRDVCGKCGATRVDQQLGLEATPDEYVARMVEVFREIRRVLADHGTCWVNLGDSYAGSWGAQSREDVTEPGLSGTQIAAHPKRTNTGTIRQPGLKPKDLCGIPWMVAFALRADGWYLRSDIVWSKPNPMPESVTDRPTKAHEYVFMLSKAPWRGRDPGPIELNLSTEDARWLALLVDTEGNICVKRVRREGQSDFYGAQIAVGSTSRRLLERLQEIVGTGNINERVGKNAPMFYWQVSNKVAQDLLYAIYPHLIVKQRQARIAIHLETLLYHRGHPKGRTVAENAELERLWQRNKECNQFGSPDLSDVPEPRYGKWGPSRYFFDQEAVREPHHPDGRAVTRHPGPGEYSVQERSNGDRWPNGGRNIRSVWEIATQPYPEAHFATFPEELARRCILAGCPGWVCGVCGKPRERITDVEYEEAGRNNNSLKTKGGGDAVAAMSARPYETRKLRHASTVGWSDCGCGQGFRPGVVLDPFVGSGTVCHVARLHGRHSIGVDLNGDYLKLAARRLQQLSLLAEAT